VIVFFLVPAHQVFWIKDSVKRVIIVIIITIIT